MNPNYSDLHYQYKDGKFHHNINFDFGCIALWKSARTYRERIRELLTTQFEVLLETEIHWSDKHFHANAARLYEAPIFFDTNHSEYKSNHSNKIGDNKFILFIIKDTKPHYTYAQSVSGKIEMSNINIVKAKYTIRDWIQADTGVKYGVHSTNNIHEFYYQVPLLLGIDRFQKLVNGEKIVENSISKDLEGADGWESYHQLFEILNLTSNYLVQRGFETLPTENPEMDIDFLTDNYQRLASAIGAKQKQNQLYKGKVFIDNREISLDLRYVGDKYYDVNWEKEMLINKVMREGVYIPRDDDYFFSLLFHAKVQKSAVKKKYIGILEDLSKSLKFNWFEIEDLMDNKKIGLLLRGFYQSNNYTYEHPIDNGVYRNKEVISLLPTIKTQAVKQPFKTKVKESALKIIPKSFIPIIKKILGK